MRYSSITEYGEVKMDDFALARANMVNSQIRISGVTDDHLLDILGSVPRECFAPAYLRSVACIDDDLPLDGKGTSGERFLMEPMSFARLVQLAGIRGGDLILDVGCATGYSSAILARLGSSVVALESDAQLAMQANENLLAVNVDNVAVVTGVLQEGHRSEGPYDVIFLNGSVRNVPQILLEQCKDGGRLVAIIEHAGVGKATLFQRNGSTTSFHHAFDAFVKPLPGFGGPLNFEF